MIFAGLPLATLLAIGGAAFAATALLYVLKLRRRPIPVPFSPIWERVLKDKEATNLFARLKRLLSLLLQLVLLALVVAALGDPRLAGSLAEGRNVVVLVDTSASMKATDVVPSRFDVARSKVREMVRGLGGTDRMLVAQMDASLTPLSTMTSQVADLDAAIDRLRATDTRANFRRALAFATDALRDLPKKEIIVVSDGALGDLGTLPVDLGDAKLSFVPVGSGADNVAITGFSVRRYPLDKSRHEVMLEVTNTTDRRVGVELSLLGDGQVTDITRLELGPREVLPRFYPDLAGASRALEGRIRLADGTSDDLPADDRAYALMPERRRSRVLVVTAGNTYLEAALLLDEYLDVTTVGPSEYPPQGSFDVTIFDGVAPVAAPNGGGLFYLNPPAVGSPVGHKKAIEGFGFDSWDAKSALLRWMAIDNVQVARGFALAPEKGDRVVGSSVLGPVLVSGRREGRRFVALGFDPRDSDLVLRVAWPLFVLNVINDFVEEDTHYVSSFKTGEVWRVPAPAGATSATIVDPARVEHRVPVKEGRAVMLGEHAGFYRLLTGAAADGDDGVTEFAANLADPDESRIEPVASLELDGHVASEPSGFRAGVRRELWLYLLLAVVLLSLLEWVTYHRRLTV